ncbi:MAG: hypothetical protein J6L89_05480 [Clostridia bacterium]|nr:hypothetical protein [Clostridia bacterium]
MSSTISGMPQSIVDWLNGIPDLRDITFMTEYPPQAKAVPLRNSIVSVGLAEVNIIDLFHENENGELVRDEYCRQADIHIVLGIHVPDSLGGSTCHEVFSKVVDYLTFSSDLNIITSTCGHITSDRNTESLVMNADIHIGAEFCPADETGINFESFASKTFFCKQHMDDTSIHVSEEDRGKWDAPCVVGSYIGSGTSARSINLGFAPKFVFAFAMGSSPFGIDADKGTGSLYFGYSVSDSHGSNGIVCTSTGFKAHNGSTYEVDNVTPLLNSTGYTYFYFAVK